MILRSKYCKSVISYFEEPKEKVNSIICNIYEISKRNKEKNNKMTNESVDKV